MALNSVVCVLEAEILACWCSVPRSARVGPRMVNLQDVFIGSIKAGHCVQVLQICLASVDIQLLFGLGGPKQHPSMQFFLC
jgi:hypothetical protein